MAVVFIDLDGTLTHTYDIRYKGYKDGLTETDPSIIPVFQGAVEFIQTLKQNGNRVIILSDSHPKYVKPIVDYWFKVEYIYLSDKPNTSKTLAYIHADEELSKLYTADKSNFYIVGDSALDIQIARKLGIPSILVSLYRRDQGEFDQHDMISDERALIKYGPTFIVKSYNEIIDIINHPSNHLLSIEAVGIGASTGKAIKFWNNKNRDRVVAFRCLARQENGACDRFGKADWYYQIDNPNRSRELLKNLAKGVSDYLAKLTNTPSYTWDYITYVSDKATTTPPKKMQEIFELIESAVPKITLLRWDDNMSSSIRSHKNYADRQSFIREHLHVSSDIQLEGKNIIIIDDQLTTGATAFEIRRKLEKLNVGNIVFISLFYMTLEVKDDEICPICGKPLSIKINRRNGTKFYSCQPPQYGGNGCGYLKNIVADNDTSIDNKYIEILSKYKWGAERFISDRVHIKDIKRLVVQSEEKIKLIDEMGMYDTPTSDENILRMEQIRKKAQHLIYNHPIRKLWVKDIMWEYVYYTSDYYDSLGYGLEHILNNLEQFDKYCNHAK